MSKGASILLDPAMLHPPSSVPLAAQALRARRCDGALAQVGTGASFMMRWAGYGFAMWSMAALAACSSSHSPGTDGGGGERCGAATCAAGQVCCNASCGICTAPGAGCPAIACVDAGSPLCGGEACAPGELCCSGCPGSADFCVGGSMCPLFDCPPPPPGCEGCQPGELCCAGCPGEGSFCAAGPVCPGPPCPPPRECAGRSYCECGGECEPLIDLTSGCICPCDAPFNCTGETCACACGGADYLGCAPAGACPDTEVYCESPGCVGTLDAAGCPTCECRS